MRREYLYFGTDKPKPMPDFIPAATRADFRDLARLADTIWREHYTPIIGAAQVDYMLGHFQSADAIAGQVKGGMHYFLIRLGDLDVGYLAFEVQGNALFLSKIYLLKSHRGQGLGKAAMAFVSRKAREMGCAHISLTVNKHNHRSIEAYTKMGFRKTGPVVTDIGGGFVMDDYRMEKAV